MKVCITSTNSVTLANWRAVLAETSVSFYSCPASHIAADAILMAGQFAFDRYGGQPERHAAQIVPNERSDGMPPYVIIPPYRLMEKDFHGAPKVAYGWENVSPAYHAVSKSLQKVHEWNVVHCGSASCISSLVLDLGLLGMNSPEDMKTPKSVKEAVDEFLA